MVFELEGTDSVSIFPQAIVFNLKGKETSCSASDLGDVQIVCGEIKIRRKDAHQGFLKETGVYRMKVADIDNFKLFLILLGRLRGIEVEVGPHQRARISL